LSLCRLRLYQRLNGYGETGMQRRLNDLISPAGTLALRVTPKASADRIVIDGTTVRVYVTTAPEDGKANAAVVKLLAKALGVPKSSLHIVRGEASRDKVVRFGG
jgi:uncharacterized protein (TIGR00251 family)